MLSVAGSNVEVNLVRWNLLPALGLDTWFQVSGLGGTPCQNSLPCLWEGQSSGLCRHGQAAILYSHVTANSVA